MSTLRQRILTRPVSRAVRKVLPGLSDTEMAAIDAGDIWWEAELFSGHPDWSRFMNVPKPELSAAERDFLDGPCRELCRMIDDWEIDQVRAGLSEEVRTFLREHRFFGMILPEAFGGLGFSAYAHSEVIRLLRRARLRRRSR